MGHLIDKVEDFNFTLAFLALSQGGLAQSPPIDAILTAELYFLQVVPQHRAGGLTAAEVALRLVRKLVFLLVLYAK